MSSILVACFSPTGTTKRAAKEIAGAVGGDLYEIRPEKPYTSADLDWMDKHSRSTLEMNYPASRPAMAGDVPDMSGYDTVFLGFPIWWYVEPRIVDTFLESCDLSGKRVIPFATSGSSWIGKAEKSLSAHCPDAKWEKGQRVGGSGAGEWAKRALNG